MPLSSFIPQHPSIHLPADGRRRPCGRIATVIFLASAAGTVTFAQVLTTVPSARPADDPGSAVQKRMQRLADIARLPPPDACSALEAMLGEPMSESERQRCLRRLIELLPRAIPPISVVERAHLDRLRAENPAGVEVLASRTCLALCTRTFAQRARDNRLLTWLDVAYCLYRDLFGVDPVRQNGHRVLIYPMQGKPGGHTTNSGSLAIMIGQSDWDNADWLERFFHELAHPFVDRAAGAHHLRSGGFAEGWPEFCQAFVPQRLAFLGPPFAGRWEAYIRDFTDCGRYEYLDTRLPIEDIVAYGPSSSLLMALARVCTDRDGEVDWGPFRRLFRDAAADPQPALPYEHWRAQMAIDVLRCFGDARATPILRQYRFPPPTLLDRTRRAIARGPFPPLDCGERRKTWAAAGETVITDWKVLGPFPDPARRRLGLDPIDEWNFVLRDEYSHDGTVYRWRTDVRIDACGTVYLGELPGGQEPGVFYLYTHLYMSEGRPLTFRLSSDDDVACWLDGARFHTVWTKRGVDVDRVDTAYAVPAKDGGRLLVKVANHGGPAGFYMRVGKGGPFDDEFVRNELKSADAGRRAAAIDYLGSRRMTTNLLSPLLLPALRDSAPEVRRAAAHALAGRRDDPAIIAALLDAWEHERDPAVAESLRQAVAEWSMRGLRTVNLARQWHAAESPRFADWSFVECESVYGLDPVSGGFYGNQHAAYGRQCIDRGWGSGPEDFFEVPLRNARPGRRTLRLRYAHAPNEPGLVHVRVRRGEQVVQEKREVKAQRTRDWQTFRWLDVRLDPLPPGWYRVELRTNGKPVDCDVIGWR